jgi:predicted methyltransferase MtxX (methanogen marker protein 4)
MVINMAVSESKLQHSPTLNTILMVEETLKDADSIITIPELKKKLPKKVNHNTLLVILEYLEESNKIAVSLKGITWIFNTNVNLRNAIHDGLEL